MKNTPIRAQENDEYILAKVKDVKEYNWLFDLSGSFKNICQNF